MTTEPPRERDIILVVDDSPETLSLLTDALDRSGAMVLVATDGPSALELVERITPDIVLLDAVMPQMDGFEVCRRLKTITAVAHVPVIFMTGLTETEHIVKGLEAGGVDYVTKPITPDEILARIRVHLANARAAQAARTALDTAGSRNSSESVPAPCRFWTHWHTSWWMPIMTNTTPACCNRLKTRSRW